MKHDPQADFAGLERVCVNSGSICWTLNPNTLNEHVKTTISQKSKTGPPPIPAKPEARKSVNLISTVPLESLSFFRDNSEPAYEEIKDPLGVS